MQTWPEKPDCKTLTRVGQSMTLRGVHAPTVGESLKSGAKMKCLNAIPAYMLLTKR